MGNSTVFVSQVAMQQTLMVKSYGWKATLSSLTDLLAHGFESKASERFYVMTMYVIKQMIFVLIQEEVVHHF
jgi:hypothetical protein